jgi:DNA invertase Pin-like site-specific DNA recombinase
MHKAASRRKFDIVMAWSVDRLGRSLQDLIGFLSELHSLGITWRDINKASTPPRPRVRPSSR